MKKYELKDILRSYYSLMAEKERFAFQRERASLLALVERATESSAAQPRAIIF